MPVPHLQKPAPIFRGTAVINGKFKDISLEDYKGKYVVFFFYPLDFPFICPKDMQEFSERFDEFNAIDTVVIACSTDSQYSHMAWINRPLDEGGLGNMNIPVLADKSQKIAKLFGVLNEESGVPYGGLFIIDKEGILRQVIINDLPVETSIDEALRLVQAIQYNDEYGEVCPAGWKPGDKTIKPDLEHAQDYFLEC